MTTTATTPMDIKTAMDVIRGEGGPEAPSPLKAFRFLGAVEGRAALKARLGDLGPGWLAKNPGWREAAAVKALAALREDAGRELSDAELAAFTAALFVGMNAPTSAGSVEAVGAYRNPRNKGELAAALRVFAVDRLGLSPLGGVLDDDSDFRVTVDPDGSDIVVVALTEGVWSRVLDAIREASAAEAGELSDFYGPGDVD